VHSKFSDHSLCLWPMWVATPSSQWTCTTYSLPVSRRTRAKTVGREVASGRGCLLFGSQEFSMFQTL